MWPFERKIQSNISQTKVVNIGKMQILMPADHTLDVYQKLYPRYDKALGEIARIMYDHLGSFTAIDIGANIGDTAALICKYYDIPVLCIEGCGKFIPYLRSNATKMGVHIQVVECFVGAASGFIKDEFIHVRNGTAIIDEHFFTEGSSKKCSSNNVKTLEEILLQNKSYENAALVKIDTDGYDFEIIIHSLNCFKKNKPVLFFEYDPSFKKGDEKKAKLAMNALWEIGYHHFLIYDNFGNFFICLHDVNNFDDLNAYLSSNRKNAQIIYYFDVCAIAQEQSDLVEKIRDHELRVVDL